MKPGKPVLILVTKTGCQICNLYKNKYLQRTLEQLPKGKFNFFILNITDTKILPECFNKYVIAFPSLLLLKWDEYLKVFNKDKKVYNPNPQDFTCKCFGMEDDIRTLEIFELPNPIETIKNWINFEIS